MSGAAIGPLTVGFGAWACAERQDSITDAIIGRMFPAIDRGERPGWFVMCFLRCLHIAPAKQVAVSCCALSYVALRTC
jgi:hypothetical protein